jgi:cystathionine beta-lyase
MAFLDTGDHVLITDSAYRPTRTLANGLLKRMGIESSFYDPADPEAVRKGLKPNTKLVFTECPGSQTFEVQDIPTICKLAHEAGALVAIDNTWSAGHYFKAFEHGCDISLQAATKYLVGHSDCMMGCVTVNEEHWPRYKAAYEEMGLFAGPDDMYLTLRGIRTLDVRLERHMKSGLAIAEWLRARDEVSEVLAPRPARRTRPRNLEAGLHRRLRPVRFRHEGNRASKGRCLPQCTHPVRHGILVGRL